MSTKPQWTLAGLNELHAIVGASPSDPLVSVLEKLNAHVQHSRRYLKVRSLTAREFATLRERASYGNDTTFDAAVDALPNR